MDGKNGEEMEYDWVKGNLMITKHHIYILCGQTVKGVQLRIGIMMMKVLR